MAVHWSSKTGFILATAGSAIGLGNIWRFPYLLSQYGGAAFLIMYLISVFGIGLLILVSKLAFGRIAQSDLPQGFEKIAKQKGFSVSKFWKFGAGYLGLVNVFLLICVYSIVVGWTLSYVTLGGFNLFLSEPLYPGKETFQAFSSSFSHQVFWLISCALISTYVLIRGVQKGIEKICVVLMPVLFISLILLSIGMFFSPGINKALYFLFHPDWTKFGITEAGVDIHVLSDALLAVIGQALYSLSLGFGTMFVYGSYMDKKINILENAKWVVIMDTLVAFLSGFIVLSALMSSGAPLNQGPELSFITLPLVFSKMKAGTIFMFIFFVLLFLAALTSIVSMYEVLINTLMKGEKMTRKRAVCLLIGVNIIGSIFILLSYTKTINLTFFGKDLFTFADGIVGEYTLPLMMGVFSLFMGWKIFPFIIEEVERTSERPLSKPLKIYWNLLLKWIVPTIFFCLILSVLLKVIKDF